MWCIINERCFSVFSFDSREWKQTTPEAAMVHHIAADQKCILALNHSVLYKPTAGLWNLIFDRQEAGVKILELEGCDLLFRAQAAVLESLKKNLIDGDVMLSVYARQLTNSQEQHVPGQKPKSGLSEGEGDCVDVTTGWGGRQALLEYNKRPRESCSSRDKTRHSWRDVWTCFPCFRAVICEYYNTIVQQVWQAFEHINRLTQTKPSDS